MTRIFLLAALCAAGCTTTGGGASHRSLGAATQAARAESLAASTVVILTWTMPRMKFGNVDTLSTAPLDWQAAYSTQSATWRNHEYFMRHNPDTLATYWAQVVIEAAPIPVASGTATPGQHVVWPAPPVTAGAWPFSWWIRTRQRPAGEWSLWSYPPVTRASNE